MNFWTAMKPLDPEIFRLLAKKYIWWKMPEQSLRMPQRIAVQVMTIGDYEDVQLLVNHVGDDYLRQVIAQAEIGQFDERSWVYWHYRLDLACMGQVPALPDNRFK